MKVRTSDDFWIDWDQYVRATEIINNWRSSHSYPLNTFQINLRRAVQRFDDNALVAQRIKRLTSIAHTGFRSTQLELASKRYSDAEEEVRKKPGTDAVLVSVESLAALHRAYPNYFADTRIFLELLNQALTGKRQKIATVGGLSLTR